MDAITIIMSIITTIIMRFTVIIIVSITFFCHCYLLLKLPGAPGSRNANFSRTEKLGTRTNWV